MQNSREAQFRYMSFHKTAHVHVTVASADLVSLYLYHCGEDTALHQPSDGVEDLNEAEELSVPHSLSRQSVHILSHCTYSGRGRWEGWGGGTGGRGGEKQGTKHSEQVPQARE